MNSALEQQGGEINRIAQQGAWDVVLCKEQATAGCVALIPRDHNVGLSGIPAEVMAELPAVIGNVQKMLHNTLRPDDVTMLLRGQTSAGAFVHVIPRFANERQYAGIEFDDEGWPGLPVLDHIHPVDAARREGLMMALKGAWPAASEKDSETAEPVGT